MTTPDLSKLAAMAVDLDKKPTPQMNGGVPAVKLHVTGAKRPVPDGDDVGLVIVQVNSPAGVFIFNMELQHAADFGRAVTSAAAEMSK